MPGRLVGAWEEREVDEERALVLWGVQSRSAEVQWEVTVEERSSVVIVYLDRMRRYGERVHGVDWEGVGVLMTLSDWVMAARPPSVSEPADGTSTLNFCP